LADSSLESLKKYEEELRNELRIVQERMRETESEKD
jgi:hypothetical protein